MIYSILSIPFGATALYFYCARRIQKKHVRALTEEEKKDLDLDPREEATMFDVNRAGRCLAVMAVCWYLGYPVIQLHKALSK